MKLFRRKQPTEVKEQANAVKRAILIGINYTGTKSELNGCINDTRNIFMWLTQECGYHPDNIRVYTDDSYISADRKPTRANIESAIQWLHEPTKGARCAVSLFMHYSGHGSWTYDRNGDEDDGRDESICPLDYATAGCILDDQLKELIVDPIANNPNVSLTCLFDCCHSGTALDLRYDFEVALAANRPDDRTYTLKQQKRMQATQCEVVLWSGCLDEQTSADAYIARTSQGAMTWGFLNAARKHNISSEPTSYKKMLSEIQVLLAKSKYEQIPHLSSGKVINLTDKMRF
jgi:hypothetical protein